VLTNLKVYEGQQALLVFLDTVGSTGAMNFDFYPLRTVTTLGLEHSANATYIDFRLGDFVNYGRDDKKRDLWDAFFKGSASRPYPPPAKSGRSDEGYFLYADAQSPPELSTQSPVPNENWESVVNQLDRTTDLTKSTFCLVLGFYQVKRRCLILRKSVEKRLEPTDNGFDSVYPIPMGKSVALKVLLSRPSFDYSDPNSARTLTVATGTDTFSGMSKNKIRSESRYNEDRTVLVCKRVFDTVLAFVSIEEANDTSVRSPRLTLLTKVRVPGLVTSTVVLGVVFGALLLGIDADVVKFLAAFFPEPPQGFLDSNAKPIAAIAKLLSALPVGIAAYVAFKRLPIK
jgi:hypothetical protein